MADEIENIHESDNGDQAFDATAEPEPRQPEQGEQPNAYEAIIKQQGEQIAALLEHSERLSAQITQMVQGGAQITNATPQQPQQQQPMQQFNPPSLDNDDDYSLEALGKEIGKPVHE